MRIFFSVGEPSGDLHASNLIQRLKSERPDIECVGFGGPKMQAAGCELLFDLTSFAIMFIWEALKNIRTFRKLAADADEYFATHQVDAVVLIDYPGFNWWVAKRAKKHGIPVYYYGVPQMWAWAPWRIRKIRKFVDHVLCKLPFEVDWFAARGCQATYVGHPYFDQLKTQVYDESFVVENWLSANPSPQVSSDKRRPLLLLLPGSRSQEIEKHLPILLRTASCVLESAPVRVAVACYNQAQFERATEMLQESEAAAESIELFVDRTPELMRAADICVACSGSVSLELMHYRKPTVIVFKISRLVMFLQSFMLRTKFITLVNLIATSNIRKNSWRSYDPDAHDAEPAVMPEYLTIGDPSDKMKNHVLKWLNDEASREETIAWLNELAQAYAKPGATSRAADYILATLGDESRIRVGNANQPVSTPFTNEAA